MDDEIGVVGLLKSFFEMSGYTVYTACNGKDALKQAGCQPRSGTAGHQHAGYGWADRLRNATAIHQLSCAVPDRRVETADKIRGFQAGADDYIVKPFDMDELGARVAAHLRRENAGRNGRCFASSPTWSLIIPGGRYDPRRVIPLSRGNLTSWSCCPSTPDMSLTGNESMSGCGAMTATATADTVMEHIRKIRSQICRRVAVQLY